jgi:hypothetical protein
MRFPMGVSLQLSIEKFDLESTDECFCVWHGEADKGCRDCKGTGKWTRNVARFADADMTGESWFKVVNFLSLPLFGEDREGGQLSLKQTSTWLKCILKAKNGNHAGEHVEAAFEGRAHAPRIVTDEDGMSRVSQGCRVIFGGYTEERLMRHVVSLERLLLDAQGHECGLTWG